MLGQLLKTDHNNLRPHTFQFICNHTILRYRAYEVKKNS